MGVCRAHHGEIESPALRRVLDATDGVAWLCRDLVLTIDDVHDAVPFTTRDEGTRLLDVDAFAEHDRVEDVGAGSVVVRIAKQDCVLAVCVLGDVVRPVGRDDELVGCGGASGPAGLLS